MAGEVDRAGSDAAVSWGEVGKPVGLLRAPHVVVVVAVALVAAAVDARAHCRSTTARDVVSVAVALRED